jgi:small multidrug resistance pump
MASCNFAVEGGMRAGRESFPRQERCPLPWIYLSAAILFEVAGITSMKLSRGLSEPLPSLAVIVFYICSATAVILALKRIELSTAYAVWSGVGTALAAMIGMVYFREPLSLFKLASLALVILGVVGLTLAERQAN